MPPPYYSMFPGLPPAGGTEPLYQMSKQQQYTLHQQQQRQYQQQQQQQYNQQQYNHQQQYNQHQELQYQQIHQKELQQNSNGSNIKIGSRFKTWQLTIPACPPRAGRSIPLSLAWIMSTAVLIQAAEVTVCSMIRRGVKLRRTLTNDRSAPLITPYHLTDFIFLGLWIHLWLATVAFAVFSSSDFFMPFIVEVCFFIFVFVLRGGKTVD